MKITEKGNSLTDLIISSVKPQDDDFVTAITQSSEYEILGLEHVQCIRFSRF